MTTRPTRVNPSEPAKRGHARIPGKGARGHMLVALLALAGGIVPALAQAPVSFPGGAQTVSEDFQDWRVKCSIQQTVKRCAVSQQQMDPRSQQRVLAIELQPKSDKAEGVLLLPFGLALDKGVTLKLGDADLGALRFSTCLPQGCVVPLSFDSKALGAIKKAAVLRIDGVADGGPAQSFSVSLKGFGPALDRAITLLR